MFVILGALLSLVLSGCVTTKPPVYYASVAPQRAYLLHLPGIGGYRRIDKGMLLGLQEGGFDAEIEQYDWTAGNPGLGALIGVQRHTQESARVAKIITDAAAAHRGARFTITCHSGGAGIAVWALEQLPPNVKIDDLLMLAPALSPEYDLSKALEHVRGHVYVIYSPYDVAVLGVGTTIFGTMDGVKEDAAGKVSFTTPATADAMQYQKLVQIPYDSDWIRLGNIGDHIGCMSRPFARVILAPLLLRGTLVTLPPLPATVPTSQASVAPPATAPPR